MKAVFADTGYWIALLNPHDELHECAQQVSKSLAPVRIVTSEMVLVELLNYFAGRGSEKRLVCTLSDQTRSGALPIVVRSKSCENIK